MPDRDDLLILAAGILTPEVISGERRVEPGFVAVRGGIITEIGSRGDADDRMAAAERLVDLGAGTLAPGFIDAHIHPVMGLEVARGLDFSGITDRTEARAALTAYLQTLGEIPVGGWVLGWGLDPAALDGVFDNSLLDGIAQDLLVFITLFDAHGALVSEAALAVAGITGTEVFEDASSVGVHQGRPTGVLFELSAVILVQQHIPTLTFDERVDALSALLEGMAATGLVAGQMLDLGSDDTFDLLEELERRGDLGIRLMISPWLTPGLADDRLDELFALQGRRGRRWEVDGVKLMIDGTIDNGTAWLFEPDTHGGSTDSLWLDPQEYRRAVDFFHRRSVRTTTHAIGDKGISFVAETLASLEPNGTQHRIEHIETLPDEVLEQIVVSGAAASMQPTHCTLYTRADHTDNWSERLGDERADLAWRVRDLRDRGVAVALGSDWFVAPYDPRVIFASAQLRRPPGRYDVAPVQPDQGLSARRALEGYTSQYWASIGRTGGTIEVGNRADFSGFADNPLSCDPDTFASSEVLLTVVDGDVVTHNRAG